MSQSWIVSRLPDRPFLRWPFVGAFVAGPMDGRWPGGRPTDGQTSSPRGRRPDRFSATIGQTSSVRGEPRRGSRFETIGQTFSPWAGKGTADRRTDLFAGAGQSDRPFRGCRTIGQTSSRDGPTPTGIRQWDRPFVGAFVAGPMDGRWPGGRPTDGQTSSRDLFAGSGGWRCGWGHGWRESARVAGMGWIRCRAWFFSRVLCQAKKVSLCW
jgi:hypothetical protein